MWGTLCANPALGGGQVGGRLQGHVGRWTPLTQKGEAVRLSGAELDSTATGQGVLKGLYLTTGDPSAQRGQPPGRRHTGARGRACSLFPAPMLL